MDKVFGVDPGNNGGAVMLYRGLTGWRLERSFKLERGEAAIVDFFRNEATDEPSVAYLEKVHGWGAGRSFNFGKYYGFVRGVLMAYDIPIVDVMPRKWMEAMGVEGKSQTKEKRQSMRLLAGQVQDVVEPTNWNSAAILIGFYGLKQEGGVYGPVKG